MTKERETTIRNHSLQGVHLLSLLWRSSGNQGVDRPAYDLSKGFALHGFEFLHWDWNCLHLLFKMAYVFIRIWISPVFLYFWCCIFWWSLNICYYFGEWGPSYPTHRLPKIWSIKSHSSFKGGNLVEQNLRHVSFFLSKRLYQILLLRRARPLNL